MCPPLPSQNLSHSGKKQRLGSAVSPPGSDTEWPAARAEPPEAGDRQHKQLEEHQHLSFVQTHLASLVEVGNAAARHHRRRLPSRNRRVSPGPGAGPSGLLSAGGWINPPLSASQAVCWRWSLGHSHCGRARPAAPAQ